MDQVAQSCCIRFTSAFEQLVVLTKHWLKSFKKNDECAQINEELKEDVKRLGGYLQLLLQVRDLIALCRCISQIW